MDDIEWTLQAGRRAFAHRRAVVVLDRAQAIDVLAQPQRSPVLTGAHEGSVRPVAFLFSGQGSQYAGMGASLYAGENVYRDAVDRCATLLQPHLGLDMRTVLFATASYRRINETGLAQPALFVTEYALASLWGSWGIQPTAMLGHSIGEYVAAHLSGVMSLEDALAVVATRGKLMQALPPGAMAAVHLPEAELRPRLGGRVEIAAINAPALCTISGTIEAVSELVQRLQVSGVETRALHTSHAFHSSMMESVLAPFSRLLQSIRLAPPAIPYVSNLTGTWITPEQATSPAYYADHLRHAVNFLTGLRTLAADPATLLLEVGPGDTLTTLARLTLGKQGPKRALQSLARAADERRDTAIVREAAGRLWLAGADLDFEGMHAGAEPRRVPLPTYPFERKRYWVDAAASPVAGVAHRSERLDDWLYAPTWTRDDAGANAAARLSGTWLVLGNNGSLTQHLLAAVRTAGATAILVERGPAFHRIDGSHFVVRSGSVDDITAVGAASLPAGAIHLWGVGSDALPARGVYDALVALGVGLGSVSAGAPVQVIHASTCVESVLDETGQQPESALAWGPVLTLPTEMPRLRMRSVDLEVSDGVPEACSATFALLTEAAAGDPVSQYAWRRGRRWLKRYEPVALPPVRDPRLPLKSQGVYLITGALGGIGLTLAQWLAREFQARLLLTARSGLPPRDEWDAWLATQPARERAAAAIAAIRAIEVEGGEVIVAAADAADEAQMSAAIAAARERWGRIDGVIHAAGIIGTGTEAALQSAEDTRTTLSPKVAGLEVLVRLLGQVPLDFVALMSSASAVLGTPGACAYAAANAVLDAFAEGSARPSAWRHVVSFNWDACCDVGMAANLAVPQARQAQWKAFLASAIPPALGVEAFARGLASRRRRVVVVSHDLLAELRKRESATLAPAIAASPEAEASASGALTRPELSSAYDEPQSDLERRLASIWTLVLGIDRIGRHDDFFELGGHSLLGTRVLAHVQEALGAGLALRDIFDAPTVHKMAKRIEVGTGPQEHGAAGSVAEEREEIEF